MSYYRYEQERGELPEPIIYGGYGSGDPSELLVTGILDARLHYHTVWDRAWAMRHGVAQPMVCKVAYWDYTLKLPACNAAYMRV